jgi:hypothetical protein
VKCGPGRCCSANYSLHLGRYWGDNWTFPGESFEHVQFSNITHEFYEDEWLPPKKMIPSQYTGKEL